MFGIVGTFYNFEFGLKCLTQRTPTVSGEILDQKSNIPQMEDKQVELWKSVCPLLNDYMGLVKMPYDSIGEHNAKADIALLLGRNIYLVQLKSHESQAALHFKKQCKVLINGKWVVIPNPPVFWCDSLPTRIEFLDLLIHSGFTSSRYDKAKEVYMKLTPLKGKEVCPRTLKKNMESIDDLITLGLIRQRRDGLWTIV